MFKVGDKVKLKQKPNNQEVTGSIIAEDPGSPFSAKRYKVKYDGNMCPDEDWHLQHELTSLEELPKGSATLWEPWGPQCECGAQHDRHFPNIHSSYCPKYRK